MTNQTTATDGFVLNQTMMRIKDPAPSLNFYQQVLGMTLYQRVDFDEMSFSLYFLGYPSNHLERAYPASPLSDLDSPFSKVPYWSSPITGVRKTTKISRDITTAMPNPRLWSHRDHGARCGRRLPTL